ncbi:MAG: GlsB/YeaQ/YmgE family stress response membrane protein [Pseudomonadales bacterium]
MGILSWIVFGLIAGILAKWIMPGKDGGGFIMTTIIGVAGAFLGGFIGSFLGLGSVGSFSVGSFITAICGALVLLFVFRKIKG